MAVLKLHLEDFDEVDYQLIAIHSTLEDYRLAYFINQKLPVILSKKQDEVSVTVKEGEAFFSKFFFDDLNNDIQWTLISNKNEVTVRRKSTGQNLFLNTDVEIATKVYLLSELKKVDYFLKIENNIDTFEMGELLKNLKSINRISTVYAVEPEKIKSKNNLIF
jgi:hypothetical protein